MGVHRFRPRLAPTLATLVMLPALVALGLWQLDRAQQKAAIRDAFVARAQLPPVELGSEPLDADALEYRWATARGRYEADHQVLLDNKVYRGRPGYHVLTPLRVERSAPRLLVNRGWVGWGEDRQRLPDVMPPTAEVTVRGRLRRPASDQFTLERAPAAMTGPMPVVWQRLDLALFARQTGYAVQPLVLELDADASDAGGFVRDWPVYQDAWISRHRGYALQWFALAAAVLIIYVVVNVRGRRDERQ